MLPQLRSPEELEAIRQAQMSASLQQAVALLTSSERIRGCQVNSDRAHLQALQDAVGWTIGGYDTRPTEEGQQRKQDDRLHVLVHYRQPEIVDPQAPPRIAMYDYLCESLFDVPMRPVGPDVVAPNYLDSAGNIVEAQWVEADWAHFWARGSARPTPVLRENRYPYQLPTVDGQIARHAIMWWFHAPGETLPNPADEEIDSEVLTQLLVAATSEGYDGFDYIWYRNPNMSVPDLFHVQIFWRLTEKESNFSVL